MHACTHRLHGRPVAGRRSGWLLAPLSLAPLSLALLGAGLGLDARSAVFQPGQEADPATGDVLVAAAPAPEEPLRGSGIRWALAPWRVGGSLAVDARVLRTEDRSRIQQGLFMADVDMASHVWQPWFIQVRLGLGMVAARTQGSAQGTGSQGLAFNGRAALMVFPASRFPFELRADLSDSRSGAVNLGSEYRSQRVSMSQGYRPAVGGDHYRLQWDHSQLRSGAISDTLDTFAATGVQQRGVHALEAGLSLARNRRSDGVDGSQLSSLVARHSYQPASAMQVETMASWNEVRLGGGAADDTGSDVRQISSFATWRLRPGSGLMGTGAPLIAATARWVQALALGGQGSNRVQALNATLGASQDLSSAWRVSASAHTSQIQARAAGSGSRSLGGQAVLGWTPASSPWGGWRYAPAVSANAGFTHDSGGRSRELSGLQGSHGVSREVALAESQQLSFTFNQSAALLREAGAAPMTRSLAHSASLAWQGLGSDGSQSYGGLSISDALSQGTARGRFQLVNLQLSHRAQFSRHASANVNVTAQASHNQASELDAFTGERRDSSTGWQRFYGATLSYQHLRALGVPRLRFSVLLGANSQALERRALGDIDAPRERISESLESRLEYAIGRLDTRLSARVARVDGRVVAGVQARAQRRF